MITLAAPKPNMVALRGLKLAHGTAAAAWYMVCGMWARCTKALSTRHEDCERFRHDNTDTEKDSDQLTDRLTDTEI